MDHPEDQGDARNQVAGRGSGPSISAGRNLLRVVPVVSCGGSWRAPCARSARPPSRRAVTYETAARVSLCQTSLPVLPAVRHPVRLHWRDSEGVVSDERSCRAVGCSGPLGPAHHSRSYEAPMAGTAGSRHLGGLCRGVDRCRFDDLSCGLPHGCGRFRGALVLPVIRPAGSTSSLPRRFLKSSP